MSGADNPAPKWRDGLKGLFSKPSGEISKKQRERVLARYRAKGVTEDDLPPEWLVELTDELWQRGGVEGQTLWDLVNTSKPYPKAVPILADWLDHLDERAEGPVTRWNEGTREGLLRALTTDEAKGTNALDVVLRQFDRSPRLDRFVAFAAGNAVKHLAGAGDFDKVAAVLRSDNHPDGKAPLVQWVAKSRRQESLGLLLEQLAVPDLSPDVLKALRAKKLTPAVLAEIRPQIEEYADYPGDPDGPAGEIRKQAKAALAKLYPAG